MGWRVLEAKQINHGQSEIWLVTDNKELTRQRTFAKYVVANVVRRYTAEDVFEGFYAEYHVALEPVAWLSAEMLDAIATELKL